MQLDARIDLKPRSQWVWFAAIAGLTATQLAIEVLRVNFGRDVARDHILGLIPFFDFNEEKNLPSWFSSLQLAFAAFLVTSIALRKHVARERQRIMWAILAAGFWFLSIDEMTTLHENWARFDIDAGLFTYGWVMVAIPIVAAVGLLFSRFVFSLPKSTRNAVIRSGVLYVWSAVGVEMLQALYHSTYRIKDFYFHLIIVVEETGEMLAIALFIVAMLKYIEAEWPTAATAP
jgi:hypothetical protein